MNDDDVRPPGEDEPLGTEGGSDDAVRQELLQLASIAAHQLKSPLNTIHTVLATIVGGFLGPIDPRQRQLLEKAAQSCTSSMKLVTDLLRLRSLDELRAENLVPVNLATVFETALDRLRDAAQTKGVDLRDHEDVQALRLAWIRGDAGVLAEVFHVLLDNAIKYTPQGGTVSARLFVEPVDGEHDEDGNPRYDVVFEVIDTGIGIPEGDFDKIFGEFYRSANATSLGVTGTGLGLPFAARAARVMRGRVELASAEQGGVLARAVFPQCPTCVKQAAETAEGESFPWSVPDLDRRKEASQRVVVVGGVAAGAKVAAKVMRLDPDADVTIVERGRTLSYAGCSLPYYISGVVREQRALAVTPLGEERDSSLMHEVRNARTLNMSEVVSIDRKRKAVRVRRLVDGSEQSLPYDKLVLATGSRAVLPQIEGESLEGVYRLDGVAGAEAIRAELEGSGAKDVVIVGGGLVGCYMIEPVAMTGARVSVIEQDEYLLRIIDPELAMLVARHLGARGVKVHTSARAVAFEGDRKVRAVRLEDGRRLNCDFVIVACGFVPESKLAVEAGLDIGETGAIWRDENLRTSDPDIFAVGDCAQKTSAITGKPDWIPSGGMAVREGRMAALNVCGGEEVDSGILGSVVMQMFGLTVARTGFGERRARREGFDPVVAMVPSLDAAHYMPTAKPILVKLLADRETGRLLGAQGIGEGRLAKRIDVVAAALASGLDVDRFSRLDVGFAPPVSIAMDALLAAANVIRNKRAGLVEGIRSAELARRLKGDDPPLVVDVRLPSGHGQRRLAGSINIPLGSLRGRLHELPRDRKIVIVSRTGLKSYEAALILKAAGFPTPTILDGGLESWPFELETL
jgi:NADPH-dependent 2,4-dienoyl-CoA reductase/sulfur reductase-like enzyme/rhodanese-related sulfurtransferase/nitrogen-specific signal transduction histidine kinase